jgi:hypothetical protein
MKRFLYVVGALAVAFTLAVAGTAEAKGKIKFKMPKRFDTFQVKLVGVPETDVYPSSEIISFLVANVDGIVYYESFDPGDFKPNAKGTTWKYKRKRDKVTPMTYKFLIKEKIGKLTGEPEYHLKIKAEADLWRTDPNRNSVYSEEDLANMTFQMGIGDDVFYLNDDWERLGGGVVKGWKLDDEVVSPPTTTT